MMTLVITSNVTGHHRGPKQKLWAAGWLQSAITTTHVLSMRTAPLQGQLYFSSLSVVLHAFSAYARAVRIFDIRASSSPLG